MRSHASASRRGFLKGSLLGGLAAMGALRWPGSAWAAAEEPAAAKAASRVALTAGGDRVSNTVAALKPFAQEVAAAIGNRRVIIKPNNVAIDNQLSATHADNLEGILEFLKSIGKAENAIIAESAGNGSTLAGFANYKYDKLAGKYGVKLVDLDQEGTQTLYMFDEKDFRPHAIRMSKLLLDPNSYVISAAKLKTHDRVVATLSLKNIILGAPVKHPGFAWGRNAKPGSWTDKPIAHGSGFRGLNYNLYAMAKQLHPHLSVIDGYEGLQGNGPVFGTGVDHKVCVASTDWLAADRVGVELMGIDFAKVGYLNFCASSGLGEGDLKKIEVVGEPITPHVKSYKLHENIEQQLIWMKPAGRA